MESERWHQIEGIFHSARDRSPEARESFLRDQCAGDTELLTEVRSLLAAYGNDPDILRKTAQLWPGDRFHHYEIVRQLGSGGMGTVYLARDTRLNRLAALKLLRDTGPGNTDLVRRFQIEARAASALTHPNIITIYDADEWDGRWYIASEYVEGETLRQKLGQGRIALPVAIDLSTQVAAGIAAAHRAGIVHRDLKPENVVVRSDGTVKILDFGLARSAAELEGETAHTAEGAILGTVPYMSPEQVDGRAVDERTDVWSLGVLVHEMATGRHPFAAPTPAETMAHIRAAAPSFAEVPRSLQSFLRKALRRDPAARYRSGEEAAAALLRVPSRLRHRLRQGTATAAALLVLIAASRAIWNRKAAERKPGIALLTDVGNVAEAALSPDGRFLAYSTQEGVTGTLRLRQLATRSDLVLLPPVPISYKGMCFSPDGTYLYYNAYENARLGTIYRIPVIGGPPQKIIEDADTPPALSPDGLHLAFVRLDQANKTSYLVTANADGSLPKLLATRANPEPFFAGGVSWSPDASAIAATARIRQGQSTRDTVVGIRTASGQEFELMKHNWWSLRRVAWTENGLYVIAAHDQSHQVFRIDLSNYSVTLLTNDVHGYETLSGSRVSNLVAVQKQRMAGVAVAPANHPDDIRLITTAAGRYAFVSWIKPGSLITQAVVSGIPELWTLTEKGGRERNTTGSGAFETNGRACGDGRYIVFVSIRTGSWRIWRTDPDGTNAVPVTSGPGDDGAPSCSPDGEWLFFNSNRLGRTTLWKTSIKGGTATPLTNEISYYPEVSPDGRWIACGYIDTESKSRGPIAVLDVATAKPVARFAGIPADGAIRWSTDSRALTWIRTFRGVSNLFSREVNGRSERQLTHFRTEQIFAFDWSRDGSEIAYVRGMEARDAVKLALDEATARK